jgi:CheY-like chemotaxis protein
MLLKLSGHDTRVAHSAQEALRVAAEFGPEAAFLDIGLPDFNGYELARRLRLDAATADMLLVALTGWGTEEDRRRAHQAGFDRHLVKPVDLPTLQASLLDVS